MYTAYRVRTKNRRLNDVHTTMLLHFRLCIQAAAAGCEERERRAQPFRWLFMEIT